MPVPHRSTEPGRPRHRHPTHWLISTQVLEYITNIFFPIGWIWRLALSFVYLFYMLKIREAAAREGGFQDHPVLCGNECCETYWCRTPGNSGRVASRRCRG